MKHSLDDKMQFGKYKGLTIQEVIEDHLHYMEWLLDEVENFELDDEAMKFYEEDLESTYGSIY